MHPNTLARASAKRNRHRADAFLAVPMAARDVCFQTQRGVGVDEGIWAWEQADMALIELSGIEKKYALGENIVHALRGASLSVDKGEMVAIMGASGSGKSTMLNVMGTLDRPDAGTYVLDGES